MVCKAGRPSTQGWRDEEQRAATAKMLDARRKRPGSPQGYRVPPVPGFLRHHQTYLLQVPGRPQTKGGKNGHREEQRPSLSLESPRLVSQEKQHCSLKSKELMRMK